MDRAAWARIVEEEGAARAGGGTRSLDPARAVAGIDEYLAACIAGGPDVEPLAGTVHLHCTDVEGEWLVADAPAPGRPLAVRREHAKGDVAVRGPAADLLLLLWGQLPLDAPALEVFGDPAVAGRLVAHGPPQA